MNTAIIMLISLHLQWIIITCWLMYISYSGTFQAFIRSIVQATQCEGAKKHPGHVKSLYALWSIIFVLVVSMSGIFSYFSMQRNSANEIQDPLITIVPDQALPYIHSCIFYNCLLLGYVRLVCASGIFRMFNAARLFWTKLLQQEDTGEKGTASTQHRHFGKFL